MAFGLGIARKQDPLHSERITTADETLRRALPIAAEKGMTRLADITGLDRVGIPIYSAVVPGSEDGISVYNGKGLTAVDSRTSAVMEAIERQTALAAEVPVIEESYERLRRSRKTVVDPRSFNHKLSGDFGDDVPYLWMEGFDLLSEESIFVPVGLAGYGPRYTGDDFAV